MEIDPTTALKEMCQGQVFNTWLLLLTKTVGK